MILFSTNGAEQRDIHMQNNGDIDLTPFLRCKLTGTDINVKFKPTKSLEDNTEENLSDLGCKSNFLHTTLIS